MSEKRVTLPSVPFALPGPDKRESQPGASKVPVCGFAPRPDQINYGTFPERPAVDHLIAGNVPKGIDP